MCYYIFSLFKFCTLGCGKGSLPRESVCTCVCGVFTTSVCTRGTGCECVHMYLCCGVCTCGYDYVGRCGQHVVHAHAHVRERESQLCTVFLM